MNLHRKQKVVNSSFRIAWLLILATITYRLYKYYKIENLVEYKMQNSYTDSNHTDSVKPATLRDSVAKEINNIQKRAGKDSISSIDVHINPSEQNDSVALVPVALHPKSYSKNDKTKNETNAGVLQGPSAIFSHAFTIAAGKTIPVNILWADSGATAFGFKLITIKANDIADEKAGFTIEDPFHVLLFSETRYAAHDKIIIEDDRHNLNISVLQVNKSSVVVNIASHLNEHIVNTLQKVK